MISEIPRANCKEKKQRMQVDCVKIITFYEYYYERFKNYIKITKF